MKLKINSSIVSGFTRYSLMSSMDALTDIFMCSSPIVPSSFSIKSGMKCVAMINDSPKVTGHIGSITIDSKESSVTWIGTDKTSDLIDCQCLSSTGEWKNQNTMEIVSSLVSPFGIKVYGESGTLFKKYNIERSSYIIDSISELCSLSGLLATSDSNGDIVLENIGTKVSDIILKEGENLKWFKMLADVSKGHSEYTVLGQSSFNTTDRFSATQVSHTSKPAIYPRIRPLVISLDLPLDYDTATSQAEWLMRSKHSNMEQIECEVSGLLDIDPNTLIRIISPSMQVNGMRLISFVKWKYSKEEGHTTLLSLCNPYKYGGKLEPMTGWIVNE